jgi:hypothetical protein
VSWTIAASSPSSTSSLVRTSWKTRSGGDGGAGMIAEAAAWLAAEDVRASARLSRVYLPDVA